jgi:5'-nucleotidase
MRILLTNDDGPQADGLHEFAGALGELGDVTIVVPEVHRSGVGHSMCISDPLRVVRAGENLYLSSGFPADCVKYALCRLYDAAPDLVVSGINSGENTGVSVFYSGTVGGAREGALNGITSVALSADKDCSPGSDVIVRMAMDILKRAVEGLPAGSLLNVNIPSERPKGIRVAPQGRGAFQEELIESTDPRRATYFWFDGRQDVEGEDDTDVVLYRQGYVTVTPLSRDETDRELLGRLHGVL